MTVLPRSYVGSRFPVDVLEPARSRWPPSRPPFMLIHSVDTDEVAANGYSVRSRCSYVNDLHIFSWS